MWENKACTSDSPSWGKLNFFFFTHQRLAQGVIVQGSLKKYFTCRILVASQIVYNICKLYISVNSSSLSGVVILINSRSTLYSLQSCNASDKLGSLYFTQSVKPQEFYMQNTSLKNPALSHPELASRWNW